MVRLIFILFCIVAGAWADAFDDKIKNLMGEQSYQTNANFINRDLRK